MVKWCTYLRSRLCVIAGLTRNPLHMMRLRVEPAMTGSSGRLRVEPAMTGSSSSSRLRVEPAMTGCAVLLFCLFAAFSDLSAQRRVTFTASDGLEVTADLYLHDRGAPYIILLHQENGSRGEYREIAPRLQRLGFNCLAVDLRSGRETNYVQNETAILAQRNSLPVSLIESEKDVRAAMEYIQNTSIRNRYIIFGSSFSASLAMKLANQNWRVAGVIAFSPGEFFAPQSAKGWLTDFDRMVYVASTRQEQRFVEELVKDIPPQHITKYQSQMRGASALFSESPHSNENWMSLMLFINKVKEEYFEN